MATTALMPQRLYLIQVGTATLQSRAASFGCYLIRMSDGMNVLVDSGLPAEQGQPPAGVPVPVRGQDVVEQLASIGLQPDDIDMLICSHFDGDHAGNISAFPHAQLVVQRQHYEVARNGHPRFANSRAQWDQPAERYRMIDGDFELLPGLRLIETSGHVQGHQSVLVRLPHTGPVLLAIDAVSGTSEFTRDRKPGRMDLDPEQTIASTQKLLDLVERERVALTVVHHDGEQWQALKKLPNYYD